jgi:hypothetical protein
METIDEMVLRKGRRYCAKMRPRPPDIILNPVADAERIMGVWDCQEKRFVMRSSKTGEWVPEKWNPELDRFEPDESEART